jgi:hypothetical protein
MARRPRQLQLHVPTWGGARRGAGRPRTTDRASSVAHRARPEHDARHPVHVTLRARDGLPSFRAPRAFAALTTAIARGSGDRFRIIQFSVQVDHVHVIVEAADKRALSLGVAGFRIRAARAFNRTLRRIGPVWSGKYHARVLHTPREARTAMVYVLQNWRKHVRGASGIDGCSSGPWFENWAEPPPPPTAANPTMRARTWLASRGWLEKGGGKLTTEEGPTLPNEPQRSPKPSGPFVALSRSGRRNTPRDSPAPAQARQGRFLR